MKHTRWLGLLLVVASCGGPTPPPGTASPAGDPGSSALAPEGARDLKGAKTFDATGRAFACEAPRTDCPEVAPERDFLDRCRMSGFQVRQCGCAMRCAGDVSSKGPRYFDAQGAPQACTQEKPDCAPTQPSAAFQDACAAKGHKLVACDCVWFCSGKPAAP